MHTIYKLIFIGLFCLTSEAAAQVSAEFEVRNGYQYAVITNYSSSAAYVEWQCVNYITGETKYGNINLLSGYETCIGPNLGWYWLPGEELIYRVGGQKQYNISFRASQGPATPPNNSSDGYIYTGTSVKYRGYQYKLYKKNGHKYIYDRVDGWLRWD